MKDMEVGALAYDTVPLSSVGRLDPFAPEFQALVTDKGAIILNMLRWVIGDAAFDKTVRTFLQQYAGKSATVDDFRKIAEQIQGDNLTWFFSQWIDSTGAPEFKPSTRCTAWPRASAPWARSRKTWTCSACRWN